VQTLYRAGLDPVALDVEPLSACRSLVDINRELGAYDHTYALLNIGANTTDFSIIRRGLLNFTRPVPLAGDNVTNAIAEALGYEFHEAERIKLEQGTLYIDGAPALQAPGVPAPAAPAEPDSFGAVPSGEDQAEGPTRVFDLGAETEPAQPPSEAAPEEPSAGPLPSLHTQAAGTPARQIYEAMLPTLVELVTEVRRSIEYYVNRFPDSQVDKILVFGGTARLPKFPEFLTNEVGISVEVGNPFQRLETDPSGVSAEFIEENACFMPIAVGLAIRDMLE
jgi:type IV pilus assembly protein PilM